jgi:hypothetical protein
MRRIAALAATLAAFTALGAPELAQAQTPPTTLTGEAFQSSPVQGVPLTTFDVDCNVDPTGNTTSTLTYSATGPAVGPYPGTFEETGTVVMRVRNQGTTVGTTIDSFVVEFEIVSGTTTITGSKRWTGGDITGHCADFGSPGRTGGGAGVLSYEATIETASGTFHDEGTSVINVGGAILPDGTIRFSSLQETFRSRLVQPTPVGPTTVVLTPPTATNVVGSSHTVTATATTASGDPTPGFTVYFTVTGAVSATGSCTTDANGQCSFTYTGPNVAGEDLITGCVDTNRDGDVDPGEPCGTATKTWVVPVVVLTPPTATNVVGSSHTVTATVTVAGQPAPGFTVYFTVTGAVSATGSCTTDANGQCTFTYTGPNVAGTDLITGCVDTNRDGDIDPGEPCGTATKTWVIPVVVLTPPTATNVVGSSHTVTATVTVADQPAPGFTVYFTVTGAVSATGSCTTGPDGQCTFTYTGPNVAGEDLITGCVDTNRDGDIDPGEPCATATKTWVGPAVVVLTPPTAINTVGSTHTVTATVTTAMPGQPVPGFTVYFTVAGAVTTTGSCTTDANGQCTFTYTGPDLPGADLITGCADANRDSDVDPGEPCGEATKIWILPVTTPGQVTGGGWIAEDPLGIRVSFGFNAQAGDDGPKGNCNVIDHPTKTHIKCVSVDVLVVAGTHATFFGEATVDGVETDYRIDVDDLGEPGTLDTFKIQTDSGYVAGGVLDGGNIQIHG